MGERWTPDTWRTKPVEQQPDYADKAALAVDQGMGQHRLSFQ